MVVSPLSLNCSYLNPHFSIFLFNMLFLFSHTDLKNNSISSLSSESFEGLPDLTSLLFFFFSFFAFPFAFEVFSTTLSQTSLHTSFQVSLSLKSFFLYHTAQFTTPLFISLSYNTLTNLPSDFFHGLTKLKILFSW